MKTWATGLCVGISILIVGAILGGPDTFIMFAMAVPGFVFCMMLVAICWFPDTLASTHYHQHEHMHRVAQQAQQPAPQRPQPNMITMTVDEYHQLVDNAVSLGKWVTKADTAYQQKQRSQQWQVVENKQRLTAK